MTEASKNRLGYLPEERGLYRKLTIMDSIIYLASHKDYVELVLDANTTPKQVLERLVSTGIIVNRFELATPSMHEIFLKVAGKNYE